ncbi:MGDG synthase family glycosyltransferase [Chengkuizengella marina]|uniref:UDP-N-acetylglucosamine--LPS N-acetylglucosamine transferase n=1 Tax=Chengkuizengella marina TaxID=2507566 RepID=A0A6N9Q1E6_9BACL|nr:glycosyltransferase [Chengkuizengella marina]NBI28845.1 UDP-N-acetylglucosamine--LPS N-acetylglucosamine transferase [Chengkuizengella marina]
MKNILILSEGFGTGHTQTANAIAKGLNLNDSNLQCQVLELGKSLHPILAPFILKLYKKAVFSHPKLYGWLYQSQNEGVTKPISQLAIHKIFYAQTYKFIQQYKPDVIICTHPFPNMVISRLKRRGLNIPIITVITDYNLHQAWLTNECDMYFISNFEMKLKMIQNGVPTHKIKVSGIPIDPNFLVKHNKKSIRDQFDLKEMPTILVMGGGWGVLNFEELLTQLLSWKEKIQIVICLGNNKEAFTQLSSNPLFKHRNIKIQGYTKYINKLMDVSDLLITKPGGITSTEAIAKKLPMLFFNPIPGQEEENCKFFEKYQLGERIHTLNQLNQRLNQFIKKDRNQVEFLPAKYNYYPAKCMDEIFQSIYEKVI